MRQPVTRVVGVPRVPREHLPRPRLLERLDPTTALTVVRGPAGSGKSALLAEWARGLEHTRGLWFTVTAADRSRAAFWSAVATAVEDTGLLPAGSVMAGIPQLGHSEELRRVLERAFTQLGGPFLLVLDDAELVTDPLVPDDVWALVRQCADLSVVVATRTPSPLESPAIALTTDLTVIGPEELTLTEEEVALLIDPDGQPVAPDLTRAVVDLSAGRPLLVRALLMEARTEERLLSRPEDLDRLGGNVLRDAVVRLLVNDPALSLFLLRTSTADVVTEPLAEVLSGSPGAAAHLRRVEELGLGAWLGERQRLTLRYHHLVLRLLREEAARRIPEELPTLHAHVARWELAEGRSVAAFRQALDARDDELASRVVMLRWPELMGYREELRDRLLAIPLARMRHQPFLAALLALALNIDLWHRVRAVQYFGLALWGVRHRRPRAGVEEKLVLDVLESVALRLTGSSRGLARTRAAVEVLAEPDDRLADLSSQLVSLHNQTAISLFRLGRAGEALETLDVAIGRPVGGTDHPLHHTLAIRAGLLAHVGAMRVAREMRERSDALGWPEGAMNDYRGALYHYAACWERLEAFDHEGAQHHVDVMAPHLDTLEYQPYFVVLRAFIGAVRANSDPELLRIREHVALDRVTKRVLAAEREMVEIAGAILHHFAGRVGAARRALATVTPTAGSHAVHGVIDLAAGQPEEALARLATSHRAGDVAPRVSAIIDLVLAAAALRMGDEVTALDAACRMCAQMTHHGLRLHLVLVPRSDLLALRDLLAARRPELVGALGDLDVVPDLVRTTGSLVALTEREEIVLGELATSPSATDIAAALGVSANTVKSQLRSVYRKLGVRSREEALAVALREGLITDDVG